MDPVDTAVERAERKVEGVVTEEAETIAKATENVETAVQNAAETAAAETTGTTPVADADTIADRVMTRIAPRLEALEGRLTPPPAKAVETVETATEGVGGGAETSVENPGPPARDVTRPSQEHWWYRDRGPRLFRGRK